MKQIYSILGCLPDTNSLFGFNGQSYFQENDVWVTEQSLSSSQEQTRDIFAFKWEKENTYTSQHNLKRINQWLYERYNVIYIYNIIQKYGKEYSPILLDAGCGAGISALELFKPYFDNISYIGVDVSDAVKIACKNITQHGYKGIFFRESLMSLPFAPSSIDIIFSEGVLHHTDSTHEALNTLIPLLRPNGYILFYVYNKKGPIREFTDDYIRKELQNMGPEEAWEAMKSLTKLGIELGSKDIELDIPEDIPLLQIPAGKISLQRFIYWNVFKAFYTPQASEEELNHINFDWYAPCNAHRQSPEKVQQWCLEANLTIEHMHIEQAGITVIARKNDAIL